MVNVIPPQQRKKTPSSARRFPTPNQRQSGAMASRNERSTIASARTNGFTRARRSIMPATKIPGTYQPKASSVLISPTA